MTIRLPSCYSAFEAIMSQLLLIGAGHAHLPILRTAGSIIQRGHSITLVSLSPYQYYSGMGPGLLGGTYSAEQIRFPVCEWVEAAGGTFVQSRAVRIRPEEKQAILQDGRALDFDVLSVNAGSCVPPTFQVDAEVISSGHPAVFTVKPIEEMLRVQSFAAARGGGPFTTVVAGGGPAAVECAANLRRLVGTGESNRSVKIAMVVGRDLLPGFGRRARGIALKALRASGIDCVEGPLERVIAGAVQTEGGTIDTDMVLVATGVVPPRLMEDSSLPVGPDGSMAVNEHLQLLGYPDIFGGGDCIWFTPRPLPRAGVFAVREAPLLLHNVNTSLDRSGSLHRFHPGGAYLVLLNLGDGTALFHRRLGGVRVVFRSSGAWRLKDRIDRAFMERYGVGPSAERTEGE
jgi:NADH dehydrogenase FAD-containing subunit